MNAKLDVNPEISEKSFNEVKLELELIYGIP